MAGLLDLGYAAFFAIGAYTYGVAASWQVAPEWTNLRREPRFIALLKKIGLDK